MHVQNEWQKFKNFVEKADNVVNYFDFLVYIGKTAREFGALDYETKTFMKAAYNRSMSEKNTEK